MTVKVAVPVLPVGVGRGAGDRRRADGEGAARRREAGRRERAADEVARRCGGIGNRCAGKPVASATTFAGAVTVGFVVSPTVILKLPVALLPALSVAVHATVVAPSANTLPSAGVQTGTIAPSTTSVAVAVNRTWRRPHPSPRRRCQPTA